MELWGMWSTNLSPLWPVMVVQVKVLSVDQIEIFHPFLYTKLFNCAQQMTDFKLNYCNYIAILGTI